MVGKSSTSKLRENQMWTVGNEITRPMIKFQEFGTHAGLLEGLATRVKAFLNHCFNTNEKDGSNKYFDPLSKRQTVAHQNYFEPLEHCTSLPSDLNLKKAVASDTLLFSMWQFPIFQSWNKTITIVPA